MHKVLDSVEYVITNSNNISINRKAIEFFCQNNYIDNNINWLVSSPSIIDSLAFNEKLKFVTLLNSISFCFWHIPKWQISYKNKLFDGSWGMVAAISKAIENNKSLLDFNHLKSLSLEDFNVMVKDDTKLLLQKERVEILNEVASKMINNFNSDVYELIRFAKFDAVLLQNILLSEFTSFTDSSMYNNQLVHFNKRAQLLAADLNYLLIKNGEKGLLNIEKITACADYKIPYILREFGMISYSNELSKLIDNRIQIGKGSKEEIEIRAHAIWVVELMKQEYNKLGISIESHQINDFLWMISQIKNPIYKPYHLTITTSY
jgi:hypothetical protein